MVYRDRGYLPHLQLPESTYFVTFRLAGTNLHWLLTPKTENMSTGDSVLISIMHSLKSFTAHQANKLLKRKGRFWSKEYYDHLVRSSGEFGRLLIYILENPVKAGLCKEWDEWPWTACSDRIRDSLTKKDHICAEHSPPEAGDTNS